jgi:hypothetical protein
MDAVEATGISLDRVIASLAGDVVDKLLEDIN